MRNRKRQMGRPEKDTVKFMQVLDRRVFRRLENHAKSKGITVQELYRVIIIPNWLKENEV